MSGDRNAAVTRVTAGEVTLIADLFRASGDAGLVVFAHGSGSSRLSPRNRDFADRSADAIRGSNRHAELRFDISLLTSRLVHVTDWIRTREDLNELGIGLFGASTGAAAALRAAAQRPERIQAVVSRGGRPDLAGAALGKVRSPSLFIVGGADDVVLQLNRDAIAQLPPTTECELVIVEGATHLFEEPGALDQVASLAGDWFERHLSAVPR